MIEYDIALFIHGDVTLGRLYEILNELEDKLDMEFDLRALDRSDLQDNGLVLEACYPGDFSIEDIEVTLESLGGIEICWDVMTDWNWVEEE